MIKLVKHLQHNIPDLKLTTVVAPRFRDDLLKLNLLLRMAFKEGIERNLQIIYRRLSTKEKVSLYSNADVILFPFSKSYKGAVDPPLTLLEAMSCGGIVVASKVLSIPWVVRDGYNGFLYTSSIGLSKNIEQVFNMSSTRKNVLRRNAIRTIRDRFSISKISKQLLSFYEEILNC